MATNEVKIEGTIVSKVSKVNLEEGLKIANFILKTDGKHPTYILVKFVGRKPIELEKGHHIWLKGSLGNIKKVDGSYELGINATAYKVHDDNSIQTKPNVEVLDSIQVEEESEPSGFRNIGTRSSRRKNK